MQGVAALQADRWPEAERLLAQAVKACPEDPEPRRHWVEVLWHRGDRTQAVAQLEEVGRLLPADASAHVRIAEMQLEMGQPASAEQSVEHALDLDPDWAAAWAMRGRVMHAEGQARRALADYHRALGLSPDDRAIQWAIAELHCELEQPGRALAALNSLAATYTPGEEPQQLLCLQGLAYKKLRRYDDAVDCFSAAVIRHRRTAEILYRLAEAEFLAGNRAEAVAAAREALALDPRHEPSRRFLRRTDLALRVDVP
jgi:predicted Zn-dependent protease